MSWNDRIALILIIIIIIIRESSTSRTPEYPTVLKKKKQSFWSIAIVIFLFWFKQIKGRWLKTIVFFIWSEEQSSFIYLLHPPSVPLPPSSPILYFCYPEFHEFSTIEFPTNSCWGTTQSRHHHLRPIHYHFSLTLYLFHQHRSGQTRCPGYRGALAWQKE